MPSCVQVIQGRDGWQFAVLDPSNPTAAVEYVRARSGGPTSLWLEVGGVHNNLPIPSLARVPGIEEVRSVHAMGSGWKELDAVQELHHLRKLNFGFSNSRFDFSQFTELEELSGVWSPFWVNLFSCSRLRTFHVSQFSGALETVPNARELERLCLIQARVASLGGLERFRNLCNLELSDCSKLGSISALADVARTLRTLRLSKCRRISSYSVLVDLEHLVELEVDDCSPLPSLRFLKQLRDLKCLDVYGTRIEDGDLTHLLDHPTLRRVIAQEQRAFAPSLRKVQEAMKRRQFDDSGSLQDARQAYSDSQVGRGAICR